MDHSELILEMQHIEKLTTQERLRLAHKRRMQQMKRWSQREKEWSSKRHKMMQNEHLKRKPLDGNGNVHFVSSVMLLEAAGRNDIEEVRRLLMQGVSPDSTNEDGLTALHQCCIDDNEDMMKLLLEFQANVNAEDSEKWTPLHAAATCGHLHLVKYLISRDADLLSVNADGNMPYDICEDDATLDYIESEMAKRGVTQELIEDTRSAVETQMLADLRELAQSDGDLELKNEQGATPLHIAAANGYIRVVEFLLDNHVSMDVRDDDDWQPIHAAACWGHPDVLELLVQNGADLNAKTRNNETPQDICEDPELRERIVQLRSEQETKRLQDAQKKKIRRSQSSNTRTQSIRRTSYREKNMTSKKEAVEEAKIRIQREQEYDTSTVHQDNKEVEENIPDKEDEVDTFAMHLRRDTHGKVNLSLSEMEGLLGAANEGKVEEKAKVELDEKKEVEEDGEKKGDSVKSDATSVSTGESGNKIDIHVSVTISTSSPNSGGFLPSPGTLADLKKQRSLSRNNLQQHSSSPPNNNNNNNNSYPFSSSSLAAGEGVLMSAASNGRQVDLRHTALMAFDPPASPTLSLRRFAQAPSEVIGPPEKQGCCLIM